MRNPNVNLPNEELRAALFTRLDGNIFRLDGTTPLPIYDEVPEDFRNFDFLEIGSLEGDPVDPNPSVYEVELTINVFSTYAGYLELSRELDQVHAYLGSVLTMTNFTDVSQGGAFVSVQEMKKDSEEGTVVRHGMYVKRWTIADNRL